MDFSNERYVRLYTRETTTYKRLAWEAQALLAAVLRLMDRAGVLEIGELAPSEAVSLHLPKWPNEIVETGMRGLLTTGIVEHHGSALVWPKYLDAQEAVQTGAHRTSEWRARRRDVACHNETPRDETSQDRDETSHKCDVERRGVTFGDSFLAMPNHTVQKEEESLVLWSPANNGDNPEKVTVEELAEGWNEVCVPLGLPSVREIRGSRREKALKRLREHPELDYWKAVFAAIPRQRFLLGENDRKWRASFDWLVENDVNATKVSEERYRGR